MERNRYPDSMITLRSWTVRIDGRDVAVTDLDDCHVEPLAAFIRHLDPDVTVTLGKTANDRGILLELIHDDEVTGYVDAVMSMVQSTTLTDVEKRAGVRSLIEWLV